MLSDEQYTFSNEKIASINSFMVLFDDNTDNFTKEEINKYVKYFIEWFKNLSKVYLRGNKWNLDILFSSIIQSEINRKVGFEYDGPSNYCSNSDSKSEVNSKYNEELQSYDKTLFRLPFMKLLYFNKTNKTVTVIEAYEVYLGFLNSQWNQIGEFIIVKCLKFLNVGYLYTVQDDTAVKAMKDIINDYNLDEESFVAIKTNVKLMNSLRSK